MPIVPTHLVHAHPEFFFPDGNLVLITGSGPTPTVAFRLHRGIVHRWSPAFRDVLDFLDAASDPWTFQGCGVLVLEDDPVDFERLVRTMYDGTAPIDCSSTSFPLLASLFSLSHKYGISHIEAHILHKIGTAYPLTLPAWDMREAYEFTPAERQDRLGPLRSRYPHPLAVVGLALQLGTPDLLIPVYLDLARYPVSDIIRGYTREPYCPINTSDEDEEKGKGTKTVTRPPTLHLPTLQTTAVLRGKETLQRFIADFIKASLENRTQSPLCRYIQPNDPIDDPAVAATPLSYPCAEAFARIAHEMLVMTADVAGGVDSDPLFVLQCAVEMLKEDWWVTESAASHGGVVGPVSHERKECKEGACAACAESFRHTVMRARQHIWDCLPKWFDLRKFIEEGFEAGWE